MLHKLRSEPSRAALRVQVGEHAVKCSGEARRKERKGKSSRAEERKSIETRARLARRVFILTKSHKSIIDNDIELKSEIIIEDKSREL